MSEPAQVEAEILEEYLRRFLGFLRGMEDEVRTRLYALRLARDPNLQEQVDKIQALFDSGDRTNFLSAEEFGKIYLAR